MTAGRASDGTPGRAACEALDARDPLAHARARFVLEAGLIYLDGNSLGPLTHAARRRVAAALDREWAPELVRGWNSAGWMSAPERTGDRIARLVGAGPGEVVVADSTSVNLFKLAAAYARSVEGPCRIVTELGNFPTDLYILEGIKALLAPKVELAAVPRAGLEAAICPGTSLVVLTHVHYKTAEMFDLAAITALAHRNGAAILWDLSHSVGAVPVDLRTAHADLAVGCTYKYLNGGPGSPSFVYVRPDLHPRLPPAIAGWLGHEAPFEFDDGYRPNAGVGRHRAGTPGVLGLAALEGSLEAFDGVTMGDIRVKSLALTDLFIELVAGRCASHGLGLATPRDPTRRGSHVSYSHPDGYAIVQALAARGVIGDFRAPDILRFGFTPLYTRFVDVWDAVEHLRLVLESGEWRAARFAERHAVT